MKKIDKNVLFLLSFFVILLAGDILFANAPRICIELDIDFCPGATYATLSSFTMGSKFKKQRIGGSEHVIEQTYRSNEVSVQAGVTTEKRIFGRKLGCWSAGSDQKTSYRNLFYHNFKRWPTDAELANITFTQASDWFKSLHQNKCRPLGPRFARVDGTTTEQVGGKVCFNFPNQWFTQYGFRGDVFLPIFMEIKFPNGKICQIEPLTIKGVPRPPNGQSVNVKVRVVKPCTGC